MVAEEPPSHSKHPFEAIARLSKSGDARQLGTDWKNIKIVEDRRVLIRTRLARDTEAAQMTDRTVKVWDKPHTIDGYQKSKTVWVDVGKIGICRRLDRGRWHRVGIRAGLVAQGGSAVF